MTFHGLPYVDNCCICVRNLQIASLLIGLYSIVRGLIAMYPLFFPTCMNIKRSSGFPIVEFVLAVLLAVVGLAIIIGALLVIMQVLVEWGTSDVYVVAVFVFVPLTILYWLVYAIMNLLFIKGTCVLDKFPYNEIFAVIPVSPGELRATLYIIGQLIASVIEGFLLIYFAVVVNAHTRLYM